MKRLDNFISKTTDAAQDTVDPARAHVDPARANVEPTQAYFEPAQGYVDPAETYLDPILSDVDPAQAYFEPADGLALGTQLDWRSDETAGSIEAIGESRADESTTDSMSTSAPPMSPVQPEGPALGSYLGRPPNASQAALGLRQVRTRQPHDVPGSSAAVAVAEGPGLGTFIGFAPKARQTSSLVQSSSPGNADEEEEDAFILDEDAFADAPNLSVRGITGNQSFAEDFVDRFAESLDSVEVSKAFRSCFSRIH